MYALSMTATGHLELLRQMFPEKFVLGIDEIAKVLGCSKQWIYVQSSRNALPFAKLPGSRIRVTVMELARYLDASGAQPDADKVVTPIEKGTVNRPGFCRQLRASYISCPIGASMSSQRYPEEFKTEAVKQILDHGHSVADVCNRLGVSTHSLYKWVRERQMPLAARTQQLSQSDELRRLKTELSWLWMPC